MSRRLLLALPLLLAACANGNAPSIALQPQAVDGPCTVKKFYLLGETAVHTEMEVANNGGVCSFTVLNTNLQAFPTNSLITTAPSHGVAQAGITGGGRQAFAAYRPLPGYAGPDSFTLTIEPSDHAVAVAVTVKPQPAR